MKIAGKNRRYIKAGGYRFRLVFSPSCPMAKSRGEDHYDIHMACVDFKKNIIHLNTSYELAQNEESLLHEIIHIVSQMFISPKLKESTVDTLAEALYMVLKLFPLVVYCLID